MEGGPVPARARPGCSRFLSRIAVISDTHLPRGRRVLPEQCLKLLRGADLVLHAGDFVSVGDVRIGMVHDAGPRAGREARLAARFPECEAVVYGHTHVPQVERFQHLWILNPGSPTDKRRQPVHTMLVLRVRGRRITPELVTL